MPIDALAAYPSTQRPGTFAAEMDSHIGSMPAFIAQANALEEAADAAASTASAAAIAASESAVTATAAADAALNYSNAPLWVTGTTYAVGNVRISPVTFTPWMRITAGAGSTDPSLDPTNWKTAKVDVYGGSDTTSSATDITLTSASKRLQAIAMTASAKSVTLPNATTLTTGVVLFAIKNTGSYAFAVRANGGALLCVVNPGNVAALHLSSNASAAGVWAVGDESVVGSLGAMWQNAATTINGAACNSMQAVSLSSTQALAVYCEGGTTLYARTLNLSGTTVSAGAALGVSATNVNYLSVLALSATLVIVTFIDANTGYFKAGALSVSGTTVTAGSILKMSSNSCNHISVVAMSATQALAVVWDVSVGEAQAYALSVSGTTVTAGVSLYVDGSMYYPSIVKLTSTTALLGYNLAPEGSRYYVLTLSGTTVTKGAVIELGDIEYVNLATLSPTSVLVVGSRSTLGQGRTGLLSVSGTTVTAVALQPELLTSGLPGSSHIPITASKTLLSYVDNARSVQVCSVTAVGGLLNLSRELGGMSTHLSTRLTSLTVMSSAYVLLCRLTTSGYLQASVLEITP